MALVKRSKYWHYDFIYKGRRFQGSTDQTNVNKAKLVEAKVRSDAALEKFGIGPPKLSPLFKDFMEGTFLQHVRQTAKARRTHIFYAEKTKRLLTFGRWKDLRLSEITEELLSKYCDFRRPEVSTATINGELRTLRKALRLAGDWHVIQRVPSVSTLPGENQREFILSAEFEKEYLAVADYPLREVAILILDLGLRPEEAVSLRKREITAGTLTVIKGKSKNARRTLALTDRSREVIALCSALFPESPWLFPGRKGKHFTRGAIDNIHTRIRKANGWPEEFVLYSCRHTFATKLAESGCHPLEMVQLLGHYDVKMTQRYVHFGPHSLAVAMKQKELMDKRLRGEIAPVDTTTRPSEATEPQR